MPRFLVANDFCQIAAVDSLPATLTGDEVIGLVVRLAADPLAGRDTGEVYHRTTVTLSAARVTAV